MPLFSPDLSLPRLTDIPEWADLRPLSYYRGVTERVLAKDDEDVLETHDPSQGLSNVGYGSNTLSTHHLESDPMRGSSRDSAPSDSCGDDLWQVDLALRPFPDTKHLRSWSTFHATKTSAGLVRVPELLSEAGSSAFDAALTHFSQDGAKLHQPGRIIEPSTLIRSLWQLGLGRSSVLFPLADSGCFKAAIPDGRSTGLSLNSVSDVVDRFLLLGNTVMYLRNFAEKAYSASTAHAAEVAIASAARNVLDAVEEYIIGHETAPITIAALDAMFEWPRTAVLTMNDLVKAVLSTGAPIYSTSFDERSTDADIHFLEAVFDFALKHMEHGPVVVEICRGSLGKVSKPWLKAMAEETRFYQSHNQDPAGDSTNMNQGVRLPDFLSHKDRCVYQKVKQARLYMTDAQLGFLEGGLQHTVATPPELEWCFDWSIAERVESKCKEYERDLIMAIERYSRNFSEVAPSKTHNDSKGYIFDSSFERVSSLRDEYFSESISVLNGPVCHRAPSRSDDFKDRLAAVLATVSNSWASEISEASIPLSMTPSLTVSSLLSTQCRVFSYVTLHSILHVHDLRGHIHAHHAFSLFGSGLFTSRLASVLFSLDREPAERHRGIYRTKDTIGLRLGGKSRKDWPPASSELRLVLMDVLSDCWIAEKQNFRRPGSQTSQITTRGPTFDTTLPGELSFSIRTMPSGDISHILNPQSVHALDFLRLSGLLSPAIEKVLTAQSQDRYDRCFAVLLRLLRVKFIICNQVPQDIRSLDEICKGEERRSNTVVKSLAEGKLSILRRTQHAAHHFISTISSHFMLIAINKPMSAFERYLDELATMVQSPVPDTSYGICKEPPSIADLAAEHERTTNAVAEGLFAGQRQDKIANALSKCLEDMLIQGQCVRAYVEWLLSSGKQQANEGEPDPEQRLPSPKESFESFISHIRAFAIECENFATNSAANGHDMDDEAGRGVADLLARLDSDWIASACHTFASRTL